MSLHLLLRAAAPWIGAALTLATMSARADVVSQEQITIKVPGAQAVQAHLFSVSPKDARIKVLTSHDLQEDNASGHGISVREAAKTQRVGKVILKHALLFNGGYSESATDRPAGLLISDGATVSLASFKMRRADSKSSCPLRQQDRPALSGVFCVARDGQVTINDLGKTTPNQCREAVQSGPLLVEKPGEAAVCSEGNEELSFRTAACLRQGQLLVVVTDTPISLFGLATWLAAPAGPAGLGCERALNLAGDASSGAVYFPGGLPSLTKPLRVGPGTYPLASLILVQSRSMP